MKKTISFEFNDDDSEDILFRIVHADDAFASLYDITQWLRSEYKYNPENDKHGEVISFIEKAREKINEIMSDHYIDLERDFN